MGKPPLSSGPGSAETVVNTLIFQSLGVPVSKMGKHRIVFGEPVCVKCRGFPFQSLHN